MPGLTCNACNREFDDDTEQKLHYKSDWHRYNLKRKVISLLFFSLFLDVCIRVCTFFFFGLCFVFSVRFYVIYRRHCSQIPDMYIYMNSHEMQLYAVYRFLIIKEVLIISANSL